MVQLQNFLAQVEISETAAPIAIYLHTLHGNVLSSNLPSSRYPPMDPIHLIPRDPGISHLFFTDDLTLMTRVNEKSCNSIKNSLSLFCTLSGQNINLQKSKIILSKNCPSNIAKEVAKNFNINISNTFGKYLCFPILQKHPNPGDYQFIIDNMQRKLTAWMSRSKIR